MRTSVAYAFIVATALAGCAASAADVSDRPSGVEAKDWLPISDRLGFVIVAKKQFPPAPGGSRQILLADPGQVSADLSPPKKGYFVIKTETGWQRVVMADPSEISG